MTSPKQEQGTDIRVPRRGMMPHLGHREQMDNKQGTCHLGKVNDARQRPYTHQASGQNVR